MKYGEYNFGEHAYIDYESSQSDYYEIGFHEFSHFTISTSTFIGNLIIQLKKIADQRDRRLLGAVVELRNASVITQEMTALYVQYITHREAIADKKAFPQYRKDFLNSDYYKRYCLKGFDTLIANSRMKLDGKLFLVPLARVAMNVDLTKNEKINWLEPNTIRQALLSNQLFLHPDYRYRKLFETAIKHIDDAQEPDLDGIVAESGVHFRESTYSELRSMATRLCQQLANQCGLDEHDLLENVIPMRPEESIKGMSVSDAYESLVPMPLNRSVTLPPEGVQLLNNSARAVTVVLHDKHIETLGIGENDKKIDFLIFHHSDFGWHYIVYLERKMTVDFLLQFPGAIIAYTEDCDVFRSEIPLLQNRRIFFQFSGGWSTFSTFTHTRNANFLRLFEAYSDIYCVFATNQQDVFFTLQHETMMGSQILKDVQEGKFSLVECESYFEADHIFNLTDTDYKNYIEVMDAALLIDRSRPDHQVPPYVFLL